MSTSQTYHFCTLFDSNYLTRGIAMYESLRKHCDNFHLYVFAFDDNTKIVLEQLGYNNITVITLKEFENPQLLAVKPSRSVAEYCWTCTPSTILYVLNNFGVDNCTYVDADLYFYSSPSVLFDEMGEKSVLITEHRFTPRYDRSEIAGIYCVQFITFKKDDAGMEVLNWWVNACLDWCYDRYEDGKFGDQKYLDDWTTRFNGVHVLQHHGGGLAPWNIQQYSILNRNADDIDMLHKQSKEKFKAVFYHYHYVRFYENGIVDLGWFKLEKSIINNFYAGYIKAMDEALKKVRAIDSDFKESLRPFSLKLASGLKEKIKFLIKSKARYNVFKTANFLK